MNGRQANSASAAAGPSRTITLTGSAEQTPAEQDIGILRLRPESSSTRTNGGASSNTRSRRVVWTKETVDNEGLGRKKSKICCIYHKPKAFDESSDESSSSASSSDDSSSSEDSSSSDSDTDAASSPDTDGPNLSKGVQEKLKQRSSRSHHHHHHHHHDHEGEGEACNGHHPHNHTHVHKSKSKAKFKAKTRSSAGTQTITITESEESSRHRNVDSSDDDQDARREGERREGFRPNAYERGPR